MNGIIADGGEQSVENEGEEIVGDGDLAERVLLLKKDSEQFDNADMGLSNTVHKIGECF